ncbi:hypothetical protein NP493_429g01145 [Ridgeia piscesae]|uniref:Uncharacterized protein n=1 Tax=Ridgeia piscesae TaxID=27915 RepID=A0AAD9L1L3_RIDPI|nr:hypothetical protein NP493_429g01145 [Ridgeia piscesae]
MGYIIEKKDANYDSWSRVNQVPSPATIFNVANLIEDREYEFRVIAVNEAGESQAASTIRKVKVKDPKAATMPEIVSGLRNCQAVQGKAAKFEVEVGGKPAPSVIWFKGTRELVDGGKYEIIHEGNTHILIVHDVYGEDADEYSAKVVNRAGSRTSRGDLLIRSPPKIKVPPRFQDLSSFEKGEEVIFKIPFTGYPKPKVRWTRDGEELEGSGHYRVETGERHAILTIKAAEKSDDGPYHLQLENDLGMDSAVIKIAINDCPDPPRFLQTENIYHDSVMLSWKPPLNDGGSFITQYIVEKLEPPMNNWIRSCVNRFTFATIEGLSPCKDYQFRVTAENFYGRSEPCEPTNVFKTETVEEGRKRKGLPVEDDTGKRVRGKYTGPKILDYDRFYYDLWSKIKPQPVEIRPGDINDYYEIHEELGSGAFGVVHRATEKSTGRTFVAKFINTPYPADKAIVKGEINIMNSLHHQKLLNLHDAFEDKHEIVLVLEYLSGGELFDRIAAEDYKMNEGEVVDYVRQVCEGLCYMHEHNIVHLDIKPENILCETKKSTNVKMIDFGLAAKLDPEQVVKITTATAEFAAPEVVDHDAVGFYTDMWAVGVLAYILLSGLSPFAGEDSVETMQNVSKCDWDFDSESFKGISEQAKDFIRKLIVKQPQRRLTVHEALEHSWLAGDYDYSQHRIPSSRYNKIRETIRQRYMDWPMPMPAIGRLANFGSLRKARPKDHGIFSTYFDRREAWPRFVRKPHTVVAEEGGVISFKCKVLAATPPTITWYFDGTPLNPSIKYMPKYSGNNYELRICRIKMEDKGEYVVKAENSYGSREEHVFLKVEQAKALPPRRSMSVDYQAAPRRKLFESEFEGYKEPSDKAPSFVFPLRDRFIQEGIGVKLICSVEGKPTPKITWTKDGKELRMGGRYTVTYSLGICSLEIQTCEMADAGRYVCIAENSKGSLETSSKITIDERRASSSRPIGLGDLSPLDTSRYNGGSSYSRTVRRSTYAGPTTSSFFSSSSSSSTPTSRTYTTRRTEKSSSRSSSVKAYSQDDTQTQSLRQSQTMRNTRRASISSQATELHYTRPATYTEHNVWQRSLSSARTELHQSERQSRSTTRHRIRRASLSAAYAQVDYSELPPSATELTFSRRSQRSSTTKHHMVRLPPSSTMLN